MTVLDAAFWVVCLVLVAAGVTKLTDPVPLARAMAELGATRDRADDRPVGLARFMGAAELLIGGAALVVGGRATAALATLSYAVFTAVVVVARRRGLTSCGCFGSSSAAPSLTHVAVNALSLVVCAASIVAAPPAVADGLATSSVPWLVVLVLLAAAASIIVVDTH